MKSSFAPKLLVIGIAAVAVWGLLMAKFIKPDPQETARATASLPVNSSVAVVQQVDQEPDTGKASMRNPFPADRASLALGQELFEQNCTPCHGFSGRGDGPRAERLTIPPADLLVHIPLHADIELFRIIRDGKTFSPMPSFGDTFSPEEIWHLVNYLRVFKIDQSLAEDYYQAGLDFAAQGDDEQALGRFNEAIELSPKYALAYNSRGTVFSRLGEFERAIADHSQAIALRPDFAEAYFNRGVDHHASRNLPQALLDYSQAIELDSGQPDAYYARGLAYVASGDLAQATLDFDQALELHPDYTRIYLDRGLAYYNLGEPDLALSDLEQYLELAPESEDRKAVANLITQLEDHLSATQDISTSGTVGLTLADFPPGFEAIPPAELGLVEDGTTGEGPTIERGFAFRAAEHFEVVWGFTTLIPTSLEQTDFDAGLAPDGLLAFLREGIGGAAIKEQTELPAVADLGDASVRLSTVVAAEDLQTRVDSVAFRKGTIGAFIFVMYADGDAPVVPIDDLARTLNDRLGSNEISKATPQGDN